MRPSILPLIVVVVVMTSGCGRPPAEDAPSAAVTTGGAIAAAAGGSHAPVPIIEASADRETPDRILDPRADEVLRAAAALLAGSRTFALLTQPFR